MHPTLARFLDVGKALALLDAPPSTGDPDATAFLKATRDDPELAAKLAAAKGTEKASPDAQQAVVVLAVRAAVARLSDDAALGPLAKAASDALLKEGASEVEITQLLGTVLLEEGFSDEQDPDTFDTEFVRETLVTLPALAVLDEDKVDALVEAFVAARPSKERPLALKAADAFLSEAWGDGLQPLATEHAEMAIEVLWSEGAEEDVPRLVQQLAHLLTHLEKAGLVGPTRSKRLAETARTTLSSLQNGGANEDDELDDDEDGDDSEPEGGQPLN